MQKLILAIAAIAVIGGGAAGAYFYFTKSAEAASGQKVIEKEVVEKKKDLDPSKFKFVELDPLILPIVDDTGVSQFVSMVVALEVYDDKGASKVEHLSPRLKDAFIQDMYGMLNRHAVTDGGVIQVSAIKERLNKISAKVLGKDIVNDVLLQVVQQRPI